METTGASGAPEKDERMETQSHGGSIKDEFPFFEMGDYEFSGFRVSTLHIWYRKKKSMPQPTPLRVARTSRSMTTHGSQMKCRVPVAVGHGLEGTKETSKNEQAYDMDVSENSGFSPQIIHFNRVFHYKPSILGYPYFWKHPYELQQKISRPSRPSHIHTVVGCYCNGLHVCKPFQKLHTVYAQCIVGSVVPSKQ